MPPKPRPKGSRGSPGGGGAAAQNASSHVARQPVPPPAPGIRPVNYVDIEKEHDGDAEDGSFQTTDTIQPFVKLVCEVRRSPPSLSGVGNRVICFRPRTAEAAFAALGARTRSLTAHPHGRCAGMRGDLP